MKKILLLGMLTLSSLVMAGNYENMSSRELEVKINKNEKVMGIERAKDNDNYSIILKLEQENTEINRVLENRK